MDVDGILAMVEAGDALEAAAKAHGTSMKDLKDLAGFREKYVAAKALAAAVVEGAGQTQH